MGVCREKDWAERRIWRRRRQDSEETPKAVEREPRIIKGLETGEAERGSRAVLAPAPVSLTSAPRCSANEGLAEVSQNAGNPAIDVAVVMRTMFSVKRLLHRCYHCESEGGREVSASQAR